MTGGKSGISSTFAYRIEVKYKVKEIVNKEKLTVGPYNWSDVSANLDRTTHQSKTT
jgi:hypothetical protein